MYPQGPFSLSTVSPSERPGSGSRKSEVEDWWQETHLDWMDGHCLGLHEVRILRRKGVFCVAVAFTPPQSGRSLKMHFGWEMSRLNLRPKSTEEGKAESGLGCGLEQLCCSFDLWFWRNCGLRERWDWEAEPWLLDLQLQWLRCYQNWVWSSPWM